MLDYFSFRLRSVVRRTSGVTGALFSICAANPTKAVDKIRLVCLGGDGGGATWTKIIDKR